MTENDSDNPAITRRTTHSPGVSVDAGAYALFAIKAHEWAIHADPSSKDHDSLAQGFRPRMPPWKRRTDRNR